MRVTILDGRQIVGRYLKHLHDSVSVSVTLALWYLCVCLDCRFMAFDRHMNLVLGDSEEFRKLPPKKGKSDDEVISHRMTAPCARHSLSLMH